MSVKHRICLWSSPRNVSTALMYSWAQRKDTTVIDEPLYAFYLHSTKTNHPGRDEIISTMETNPKKVIDTVFFGDYDSDLVFIKHMAHHTLNIDLEFISKLKNIFFIRDPRQIIASYAEVVQQPGINDIGILMQSGVFKYATSRGYSAYVLDSGELLKNPAKVLNTLCEQLEIPFDPRMLHWPAGPKAEDGIWAKYWYKNVHTTTGFEKQPTSERGLPEQLIPLYEEAKPVYDQLYKYAIKA